MQEPLARQQRHPRQRAPPQQRLGQARAACSHLRPAFPPPGARPAINFSTRSECLMDGPIHAQVGSPRDALPAQATVVLFPERRQASSRLPGAGESPRASRKQGPSWSQFWSHSPRSGRSRRTGPGRSAGPDRADLPRTHVRRLGKRVGGNPSRVRISYPPPRLTGDVEDAESVVSAEHPLEALNRPAHCIRRLPCHGGPLLHLVTHECQ